MRFTRRCAAPANAMRASLLTRSTRRGATNISSSRTATNRAASEAFSTTAQQRGRSRKLGMGRRFCVHARRRRELRLRLYRDRAQEFRDALDASRSRRAAHAARTLCRIQPALRPRYGLRPEDGRPRRFHSVLDAAAGALAIGELACPSLPLPLFAGEGWGEGGGNYDDPHPSASPPPSPARAGEGATSRAVSRCRSPKSPSSARVRRCS